MKKKINTLFIFIVVFTILVSGCSTKSNANVMDEDARVYQQYGSIGFSTNDGFYYQNKNGYLYFFDYESTKDTLVCSQANCKSETLINEDSEAYISGMNIGFTNADKLYVVSSTDETEKPYALIESNLDRSGQKEICKINDATILTYAVIRGTVYFAVDENIVVKKESGGKINEPKHNSYILAVDLKTGEQKKLTEDKNNYNNQISIIAADANKIYITYSYFDKYFNGNNFNEVNKMYENYVFDIKTNQLTPILKDKYIRKAQLVGDKLFTVESEMIDENKIDSNQTFTLFKYMLPDYQSTVIASLKKYPVFSENEWLYHNDETNKFTSLDLSTQKIEELPLLEMNDVYIFEDAKDYYFINFRGAKEIQRGFILKSDYKKGYKNIIEVH